MKTFLICGIVGVVTYNIHIVVTRGECYTVFDVMIENLWESIVQFFLFGIGGVVLNLFLALMFGAFIK